MMPLPDGLWRDTLSGTVFTGATPAAALFPDLPVVLLERADA
ncbi:malto-oligosyltrehalose synthase domain protein [Mycobacterium xenopi 4042]|uniref:Malto-oligosyltrehalose synthase domain protein n=1 Tax=Mycobacterium xenopi 4042 TaxID=1299334 RepID=X7YR12_MYCXE|nr:malto-oligosyltrehalose synthase domain protein [Mycobacterium xenopi 4042]EUA35090.1 malto-oligosyltrehalose synthase domain protein [Mycobacterium xenopi 3993]